MLLPSVLICKHTIVNRRDNVKALPGKLLLHFPKAYAMMLKIFKRTDSRNGKQGERNAGSDI